MSDHPQDAEHEVHEGPIRTPKQLLWTVVASFVLPVIIIILLVNFVAFGSKPAAGSDGLGPQAVAKRLQRVGSVEVKDSNDAASMKTGQQVYEAQCTACHTSGAAGAPKVGDATAWAPRLKTGYDALLTAVLKGKGSMAAQSGGDFSDFEIARAVVFLSNQGGARFDEPALPVAAASAAAK